MSAPSGDVVAPEQSSQDQQDQHDRTRVAVVLNPVARGAARAREAVDRACEAAGLSAPIVFRTSVSDPGVGQARAAVRAGATRVIAAGGDGTVRAVVDGLRAAAGDDLSAMATLGVLPCGTANLFARNLRLPISHTEACALVAVVAPPRPVDLGRVELVAADGTRTTRKFLVVVGVGRDAETVAAVDAGLKERARWLAYFAPGLRRLRQAGMPLQLSLDGAPVGQEQLWSVLAVNGGRLPGGAVVAPGARVDDGWLHVVAVAPRHLADWARIAATGVTGVRRDWPALRYSTGRGLRVTSAEPVTVQVDGDPIADIVEAHVQIRPGALRVAASLR